jgi:hypothetical protein
MINVVPITPLFRSTLLNPPASIKPTTNRFTVMAFSLTMALACLPLIALAEDSIELPDSIRPLPLEAMARAALTPADVATTMDFLVPLKMRDMAGLQARVANGEIISRAELIEKYFPLQQDYQIVSNWLTQHGFTITQHDSNRLGILASGTATRITSEMNVSFAKVAANGATYVSAASAPRLPASVAAAILGINGLQPHLRKRVHSRVAVKQPMLNNAAPFYPSEILKAYGASSLTVSGAGQTIGIVIDTSMSPPISRTRISTRPT